MWQSHLLIAFLWMAYGAVHSLLAATRVKKRLQAGRRGVQTFYRLGYNVIAFAGLAGIIAVQVSTPSPKLFTPAIISDIIGGLLAGVGVVIMGICIRKYFTGLSGLRNLWQEHAKDELIVSGIHRAVRHPLYLGTFLAIWGAWLLLPTASFIIANCIITAYTLIGIRFEEKKLVAAFGEAYVRYRQTVPMLIPRASAIGFR